METVIVSVCARACVCASLLDFICEFLPVLKLFSEREVWSRKSGLYAIIFAGSALRSVIAS